ncbi:MAG: peptide chain release factor 2 [Patescibacteria group bacterium]
MEHELKERFDDLAKRFAQVKEFLDLAAKETELTDLKKQSEREDIWKDQEEARAVMQRLSTLEEQVGFWQRFERELGDLRELLELAAQDDATTRELSDNLDGLERTFTEHESKALLSGEHDARSAHLTIQAGAGGTDAQDWAEMLERMFLRFAERRGWRTEIEERSAGEEAGIKSVTIRVDGPYAYGYLRGESGIHRLVRQSPFNAKSLRQTSFARVEVLPDLPDQDVELDEKDLRIDTYRASGAGGQHVNKTDSAVRVTHEPTGLVAQAQSERSQVQNKEAATKILYGKLFALAEARQKADLRKLEKGDAAAWGHQIRSYVLHPYKQVKDLRTNVERKDPDAVLDGDLGDFVEAELRLKR